MRNDTREFKNKIRKEYDKARAEGDLAKMDSLRKEYQNYNLQRRRLEARERARRKEKDNQRLLRECFNNIE